MVDYSQICLGPKNTEWDNKPFTILSLIELINKQLWLKFGHFKDDSKGNNRRDLEFCKNQEIIISLDEPTILNMQIRNIVAESFKKAGWSNVEFKIWEGHRDDEEIEPLTKRQKKIMRGELDPDEYERPIPAHWQIILKK